MTPAELRQYGTALYGAQWQSPLARDLDVAVRTVQRWCSGERGIPKTLDAELAALVRRRIADLEQLVA